MGDFTLGFVHAFRTPRAYYLYDVNTNQIIDIPESLYKLYTGEEKGNLLSNIEIINNLKSKGFLKDNPIKRIEHGITPYLPTFLRTRIQSMTLQVTQQCNLRCKYCVYSGSYTTRTHSSKTMSFDIAKQAIDFLYEHSTDVSIPSIGFYGGEPLLNFNLIKNIVEYVEKIFDGRNIIYNITTNATLLNDENLKFMEDHDFHVMVSLDGPKEIHDKNRVFAVDGSGTFDCIIKNLKYVQEKFPKLYGNTTYNAVINPDHNYSCFNKFILQFSDIDVNKIMPSLLADTFREGASIVWPEDFYIGSRIDNFRVFMSKMRRIHPKHISTAMEAYFLHLKSIMHTMRSANETLQEKCHPGGPCTPGVRKLFVDVKGDFYPCERVSETSSYMNIGSLSRGFDIEKISTLLNIGKTTEDECKKCWSLRYCSLCCANSDDSKELSCEKRLKECNDVRQRTEEIFKNYCFFIEHGFSFQNDDGNFVN